MGESGGARAAASSTARSHQIGGLPAGWLNHRLAHPVAAARPRQARRSRARIAACRRGSGAGPLSRANATDPLAPPTVQRPVWAQACQPRAGCKWGHAGRQRSAARVRLRAHEAAGNPEVQRARTRPPAAGVQAPVKLTPRNKPILRPLSGRHRLGHRSDAGPQPSGPSAALPPLGEQLPPSRPARHSPGARRSGRRRCCSDEANTGAAIANRVQDVQPAASSADAGAARQRRWVAESAVSTAIGGARPEALGLQPD